MTTVVIAEKPVDVDADGFLEHPEQWTEEIGTQIAHDAGIESGTNAIMKLIASMPIASSETP